MEAKGHDRMFTVLLLEFIGTALFIWGIICTKTPVSIPFSLFASVVIFGDITGGHFNPAVTLGVFTSLGEYGKNFMFCILIMLAQFCGGMAAMEGYNHCQIKLKKYKTSENEQSHGSFFLRVGGLGKSVLQTPCYHHYILRQF